MLTHSSRCTCSCIYMRMRMHFATTCTELEFVLLSHHGRARDEPRRTARQARPLPSPSKLWRLPGRPVLLGGGLQELQCSFSVTTKYSSLALMLPLHTYIHNYKYVLSLLLSSAASCRFTLHPLSFYDCRRCWIFRPTSGCCKRPTRPPRTGLERASGWRNTNASKSSYVYSNLFIFGSGSL